MFVEHWSSVSLRIRVGLDDEEHAPEDVDELVNDVFLLAWKKWDPVHITPKWLFVVVDNKLRDRRRRQRTARRAMDAVRHTVALGPTLDELDRIALRHALSRLGEREREALTLTYWGGWTAEEVAVRFDMTPSAVWAMLSRARVKLRDGIDEARGAHGAQRPGRYAQTSKKNGPETPRHIARDSGS